MIVTVLLVLGGILPIIAVVWAYALAQRPYKDMVRSKGEAIKNGGSVDAMIKAGLQPATWG